MLQRTWTAETFRHALTQELEEVLAEQDPGRLDFLAKKARTTVALANGVTKYIPKNGPMDAVIAVTKHVAVEHCRICPLRNRRAIDKALHAGDLWEDVARLVAKENPLTTLDVWLSAMRQHFLGHHYQDTDANATEPSKRRAKVEGPKTPLLIEDARVSMSRK